MSNYLLVTSIKFFTDALIDGAFVLRALTFYYLSLPTENYTINFLSGLIQCGKMRQNANESCCLFTGGIKAINHKDLTPEKVAQIISDVSSFQWVYQEARNHTTITATNSKLNLQACDASGSKVALRNSLQIFKERIKLTSDIYTNAKHKSNYLSGVVPNSVSGRVNISDGFGYFSPNITIETWKFWYTSKSSIISNNTTTENKPNWSAATVLTYVTMGISCISLILTLGIYQYRQLFDSSPGVISKHMMSTMLIAQITFLFCAGSTYIKPICLMIGVVSHYIWLVAFCWISVFQYSVVKMMKMLVTSPGALGSYKLLSKMMVCCGYLLPLLIVIPSALLDTLTDVNIDYTGGQMCFPTGFPGNLFSFTIPVTSSLSFNFIFLVISRILISRYNSTIVSLASVRQTCSFIPIYIKLTILCACPWVLGIICDLLESDILDYCFIILAGSHGTFVSIVFLLSARVSKTGLNRKNDTTQRPC